MSEDDDMKAYGYEGEIIAVLIPKEKEELKEPRRYKVIIINDDYTPMDFVVAVLQTVFHKSHEEAYTLMLDVHTKDRGIAGVYSKEIADTKCSQCEKYARSMGYPFLVQAEPE